MDRPRQRDAVMTFDEEREQLERALSDAHDALGRAAGFARATSPALADELEILRNRLLELRPLSICSDEDSGFLVCTHYY